MLTEAAERSVPVGQLTLALQPRGTTPRTCRSPQNTRSASDRGNEALRHLTPGTAGSGCGRATERPSSGRARDPPVRPMTRPLFDRPWWLSRCHEPRLPMISFTPTPASPPPNLPDLLSWPSKKIPILFKGGKMEIVRIELTAFRIHHVAKRTRYHCAKSPIEELRKEPVR